MLERINEISQQFVDALKREFEEQGHNASGKGLQSIEHKTELNGRDISVKIMGFDYLQYVNTGRNVGKMPPIEPIKEWVQIRNIAQGKEAERAAWAIAKAIEREGIPTENAYKFSKNGRRKGFIEIVKQEQLQAILQQFRRALMDMFREELIKKVVA